MTPRTLRSLAGLGILMFAILLGIASLRFWGWTLGEVISKERTEGGERTMWLVVLLATGLLGAILFRVVRRPARICELGS